MATPILSAVMLGIVDADKFIPARRNRGRHVGLASVDAEMELAVDVVDTGAVGLGLGHGVQHTGGSYGVDDGAGAAAVDNTEFLLPWCRLPRVVHDFGSAIGGVGDAGEFAEDDGRVLPVLTTYCFKITASPTPPSALSRSCTTRGSRHRGRRSSALSTAAAPAPSSTPYDPPVCSTPCPSPRLTAPASTMSTASSISALTAASPTWRPPLRRAGTNSSASTCPTEADNIGVATHWVFPGQAGAPTEEMAAAERKADELFMSLLVRFTMEGRRVSASAESNYAPSVFAKERAAKAAKIGKNALAAAMGRLFEAKPHPGGAARR